MSPFTKQVLDELYAIDPNLRARESELVNQIEAIVAARPAGQLNSAFRQQLRNQLLRTAADRPTQNTLTHSFSPMRTWMYAVPVTVIAIAVLVWQFDYLKPSPSGGPSNRGVTISRVGAEAFGMLSSAERKSLVSGRQLTETDTSQPANNQSIAEPTIVVDPNTEVKRYEFVYAGSLSLPNLPVLRRQPSLSRTSLTSALGNSGGLNLGSFGNLQADSVTVTEERENGYSLTYNFQEGTIYLSQMYKGDIPAVMRDTTSSLAPDSIGQIRPSDVPSDSELFSIANTFLADHGISRQGLGAPQVRKDYLLYQTAAAEKLMATTGETSELFYPADQTVVYPWEISGQAVTDESGYPYGLNVAVNALTKQVSSVSNITPLTFQASDYALESDTEKILDVVKRGGLYSYQPEPGEGVTTVQIGLGTPQAGYVLTRYQLGDGTHDYLVPALIFPITNVPAGETLYQTAVVVPLVKELLDQTNGSGGGIEIKPLPVEIQSGSESSPGSSGSGE